MIDEENRRSVKLSLRLSPKEQELLRARMAKARTTNQEAFIRKMALDGMIVRLDVPEIKELISLLRYSGNNINQIAKRLNESGRIYDTDIDEVVENQRKMIDLSNAIIMKLASIS